MNNGGPGQPLHCYLARDAREEDKLRESLRPSDFAVEAGKMRKHERLQIKEKRLDIEQWKCGTDFQRGSHFPLCVFTDNSDRRRSPESIQAREKKTKNELDETNSGGNSGGKRRSGIVRNYPSNSIAQHRHRRLGHGTAQSNGNRALSKVGIFIQPQWRPLLPQ